MKIFLFWGLQISELFRLFSIYRKFKNVFDKLINKEVLIMKPADYIKEPQKFHETYTKEEMMEYALQKKAEGKTVKTTFTVSEIRGVCPLYKEGDVALVITTAGTNDEIRMEDCPCVCYGLLDNLHFRQGWVHMKREQLDHLQAITGESKTYCTHAGPPYTPCGGVIFSITRDDEWED